MERYQKTINKTDAKGNVTQDMHDYSRSTDQENTFYAAKMKERGLVPCMRRTREDRIVVSFEPEACCERIGNEMYGGLEMWTDKHGKENKRKTTKEISKPSVEGSQAEEFQAPWELSEQDSSY